MPHRLNKNVPKMCSQQQFNRIPEMGVIGMMQCKNYLLIARQQSTNKIEDYIIQYMAKR